MVSTPRPAHRRRQSRWIARAGAVFAIAGMLALALPALTTFAPDVPLPRSATVAAADVPLDKRSVPVRIQVPYAGIDLPVVSSKRTLPGNPAGYPLCDVAQWWTDFQRPGAPGTTWIYAHAQPGMFLPLLEISNRTNGSGLMGKIVELQTKDGRLLRYRIKEVRQRASSYDRSIAKRTRSGEHRLVLQTSTGPTGAYPKLQLAAVLIGAEEASEPAPKAKPRLCWQPRQSTKAGNKKPKATAAPPTS